MVQIVYKNSDFSLRESRYAVMIKIKLTTSVITKPNMFNWKVPNGINQLTQTINIANIAKNAY